MVLYDHNHKNDVRIRPGQRMDPSRMICLLRMRMIQSGSMWQVGILSAQTGREQLDLHAWCWFDRVRRRSDWQMRTVRIRWL